MSNSWLSKRMISIGGCLNVEPAPVPQWRFEPININIQFRLRHFRPGSLLLAGSNTG